MTDIFRLRALLVAAIAVLDAMEGAAPAPASQARVERPDKWLNTSQAARIAKADYGTLYRWGRKHKIGEKLVTGTWRFSERKLRRLLSVDGDEVVEETAAHRLPLANEISDIDAQSFEDTP